MHKTLTALTLGLAILAWSARPVAAQNREHQQMTAELRMLQEQTQQLALTLAQLAEALKAIHARMDASDEAARKRFADQELLVKGLGTDLNAIRERTQDTDTRLRKLADEIDALRSTVTSLPALLNQTSSTAPSAEAAVDPNAPPATGAAPQATPVSRPSTVGLSPSRMLETAKSDYYAGSYASAISGFDALIKAFGTTEAAGEAQYWIGESNYQLGRWQDASNAYSAVTQNYPKSTWAAEAYYKRGLALERLQQPDLARASYDQLIKLYPETSSARLAKQALDRLSRVAAPPKP